MTFAEELKAVRTRKGLSMAEVSRQLDIPYRTYQNYECGGTDNQRVPVKWAQRMLIQAIENLPDKKG